MAIENILKPSTVEDAMKMKNQLYNSMYLAGGTDVVINMRKGKVNPINLIDLGRIESLKKIREGRDFIEIGSMATFSQLISNESINNSCKCLKQCAETMGSPQIRNMATIGGNIINAGAAADGIPCIECLSGSLVFSSLDNERIISCSDYFKSYENQKIKDSELLIKILIPKKVSLSGFYKLGKRNSLSIARLNLALSIIVNNNRIDELKVVLGAVGRYSFREYKLESAAKGKALSWLFTDEPLKILEEAVENSIRGRKTMAFKKEAVKGVYKNALYNALG